MVSGHRSCHDLLAVTARKLVDSRLSAVTSTMTNLLADDTFDLDLVWVLYSFFGAATSGVTELWRPCQRRNGAHS